MAGTFAHITLVDSICQSGNTLDSIPSLTSSMKGALMEFMNFSEFGAVSPDAPYLDLLSKDAACWANVMHYWKTADFIRRGIQHLSGMDLETVDAQKCLAWLFGYCAHIVTDFTVHPVINLLVGPYEENKRQHRLCELNQDVYIFHNLGFGDVSAAEYISNCGIETCSDEANSGRLHPAIRKLWCYCLDYGRLKNIQMKQGLPTPQAPPDPDQWFRHYVTMIDKFAEEGGKFPVLCGKIVEAAGLVYPQLDEIDQGFIQGLRMPDGTTSDYGQVFEIARSNVMATWNELGKALASRNPELLTLANGNLDTGFADNDQPIFWNNIA